MSLLPIPPLGGGSLPNKPKPPLGGGGTSVLGIVGQIGAISNLLGGILDSKVINKTIGQALKDGWNCWGATWTPTRAENELPQWMGVISNHFKSSLDVPRENLEFSVNSFFKEFWGKSQVTGTTLESWLGWRYDSAKDCTLKGLIVLEKGIDAYLQELVGVLKQIGPEIKATITITEKSITLYRHKNGGKPYKKTVPQIKVELHPDNVVEQVTDNLKDFTKNKSVRFLGGVGLAIAGLFGLFTIVGDKGKGKSRARKLYR